MLCHNVVLFLSMQKDHNNQKKYISPATITSMIKQTVILCYYLSDVRIFAASQESPQNSSSEKSACHRKSHNTFTQFYSKNVALAHSELFHVGPVVAAEQIHH